MRGVCLAVTLIASTASADDIAEPHLPAPPSFVTLDRQDPTSRGGVELSHNDLLRVVHDVFGHVAFGYGFDPAGELAAAYCQMALSCADARPVLFAEQVAQTCWFFFGPHLRGPDGHIPRPGEPGYVPPHRRPYPEQKVFPVSQRTVTRFARMFERGTGRT